MSLRSESVALSGRISIGVNAKTKKFYHEQPSPVYWQGRVGYLARSILLLPWSIFWQFCVTASTICTFCTSLLDMFVYSISDTWVMRALLALEIIYFVDTIVCLLHACCTSWRVNIRIYRRSNVLLAYDMLSLLPFVTLGRYLGSKTLIFWAEAFTTLRIYRLYYFYSVINYMVQFSRFWIFVIEILVLQNLILHLFTCTWIKLVTEPRENAIHNLSQGYMYALQSKTLNFEIYKNSWYFTACRLFTTTFGDGFPTNTIQEWDLSLVSFLGHVIMNCFLIGVLSWERFELIHRGFTFLRQYNHFLSYMKIIGANKDLTRRTTQYMMTLWSMKDGVRDIKHMNKLPLPLQMELIFDINIIHLHNSMLFKNRGEPFLRQISLLMKNEFLLKGEVMWPQNILKRKMICISTGVIEMLSYEDDESPIISFTKGTVLGELALMYCLPAKVTLKAASYVEMQVLEKVDFLRAVVEHPSIFIEIKKDLRKRIFDAMKIEEDIREYEKKDCRLIRTQYRPMKVLKNHLFNLEDEDVIYMEDSHLCYIDSDSNRKEKFQTKYLNMYKISENVTMIEEPHVCWTSTFPWILEPDTDFTRICDFIHFSIILCACLVIPIPVAFEEKYSHAEEIFLTVATVYFVFHIYLQLTTAIVRKNVILMHFTEIIEVKISEVGFYLDLISVFPIRVFFISHEWGATNTLEQYDNILLLLQFWHVIKYFRELEKKFPNKAKLLCAIKFAVVFTILSFWTGCILYLNACPGKLCTENYWVQHLMYMESKVLLTVKTRQVNVKQTSIFFGSAIFLGSGTSRVVPGVDDNLLVVFLMIIGAILRCLYISRICTFYISECLQRITFKESMNDLMLYLRINKVSVKIQERVKNFFNTQWYYNNAITSKDLFNELSSGLKQEIFSTEVVETLVHCPLFQENDLDFLQTIAARVKITVLPSEEVVQHSGDIVRDMYIIKKGFCKVLDNLGKVVKLMGPGSYFGDLEMLYALPKVHTIISCTNCILVHVEYSSLIQSLSMFPDVRNPIKELVGNEGFRAQLKQFETSRPLNRHVRIKQNRFTNELKESFVAIWSKEDRQLYTQEFEDAGIWRFSKYFIIPAVITPHGNFLKLWCVLRFIFAFYYMLIGPYHLAIGTSKILPIVYWVDYLMYIDLAIMFYVGFYNENNLLVTHPLHTIVHYLKSAFVSDIISVFPLESLMYLLNDQINYDMWRLNRLLQLHRIMATFHYLEGNIMQVHQVVIMMKFFPIALTIANLFTCLAFQNSCLTYVSRDKGDVLCNCTSTIYAIAQPEDAFFVYTLYFYWVLELFLGYGTTPFHVENRIDMWLATVIPLIGILYFGFMFGYITSSRSSATGQLLEHKDKMNDLGNFLFQENVDANLTQKTLQYFEYVWKRTQGRSPQELCKQLNTSVMEDTLVFMYEKTLREVPLFNKVEKSFIRIVTQHLHEVYFLKGETIIQCRDIQPNIYIIYRGKVDVQSSCNEIIACMGVGGLFGNFTGQPLASSEVSIVASRQLDLLVISSQTFFNLVKHYPRVEKPLRESFKQAENYVLPISLMEASSDNSDFSDNTDDDMSNETHLESNFSSPMGSIPSKQSLSFSISKSSMSITTLHGAKQILDIRWPGTELYQIYNYFKCVLSTLSYFISSYELVTLNNCIIFYWLIAFLDAFFILDFYLKMHEGFLNRHGNLVVNLTRCRRKYISQKRRMWIDIIINFPVDIFALAFKYPWWIIHYLRANKMGRLKNLYEFYKTTNSGLIYNLTALKVFMITLVTLICIHTFTCIWLVTAMFVRPVMTYDNVELMTMDSIMEDKKLWNYSTSMYVVITIFTGTGGDEIILKDMSLVILLGVIMVVGKAATGIMIATTFMFMRSVRHSLAKYEREARELVDVLKNQGLSDYQLKKLWTYLKQLWNSDQGRQVPALLQEAPYVRRCDLSVAMFGQHLHCSYLFCDIGEPFLRQLSALLQYRLFFPGNYIVQDGDTDASMYFVSQGVVSVLTVHPNLTESVHETLRAHDTFGLVQGLGKGVAHNFSYRAETKVSMLILNLDSWINILPFFPEADKMIKMRAKILFSKF